MTDKTEAMVDETTLKYVNELQAYMVHVLKLEAENARFRAALCHIARTKIETLNADHAPIAGQFEMPYFSAQECWEMAKEALGETK